MGGGDRVMQWAALVPFGSRDFRWLAPVVDASRHQIRCLPRPDHDAAAGPGWHGRSGRTTDLNGWRLIWRFAGEGFEAKPDGIITVFPQLAAAAGMRKRLSRRKPRLVAWCLNIGRHYGGARRALARRALGAVDRFVVHARREADGYSAWYGLPRDRFEFVPLHCGALRPTLGEQRDAPFLLAMGSANRDFRALFEAVRPLGLRTVVVTSPRNLNGIDVPGCVEVRSGLDRDECRALAERARVSVVPVANDETASGQVTVIEAMWLARPVVATRCIGTEDYIDPGVNGDLVAPGDPAALREAIRRLWEDAALRERIGRAARDHAKAHYSDEAAGAALTRVLDRFIPGDGDPR